MHPLALTRTRTLCVRLSIHRWSSGLQCLNCSRLPENKSDCVTFVAVTKDTPDSDNDTTCLQLKADEGFRQSTQQQQTAPGGVNGSRPSSLCSDQLVVDNATTQSKKWVDAVSVPLMMAYITRYIFVSCSPVYFSLRGKGKQNPTREITSTLRYC